MTFETINFDELIARAEKAEKEIARIEEKINFVRELATKETASLRKAVQRYQTEQQLIQTERTAYLNQIKEKLNHIEYELLMHRVLQSIEKINWDGTEAEQIKQICNGIEKVLQVVFDENLMIPYVSRMKEKTVRKINHIPTPEPLEVLDYKMTTMNKELYIDTLIARGSMSGLIVAIHITIVFDRTFKYNGQFVPPALYIAVSQIGDEFSFDYIDIKNLLLTAMHSGMKRVSPQCALMKLAHALIKTKQEVWTEVVKC